MDPRKTLFIQSQLRNAAKAGAIPGMRSYTEDQTILDQRSRLDRERARLANDPNATKHLSPEERQRMRNAPFDDANAAQRYMLDNYDDLEDAYAVHQAKRRKNVQDQIREAGGSGSANIAYENPGAAARLRGSDGGSITPASTAQSSSGSPMSNNARTAFQKRRLTWT